QPAGVVVEVGRAERDPAVPPDDAALGAERARPRGAQELDAQVGRQEALVVAADGPASTAHRGVEERRDHAAVHDRPGRRVEAELDAGVPLDHRAAVALLDAAVAERRLDVRLRRRLVAPACPAARHQRGPGMPGKRNGSTRFGCTIHARPVSGSSRMRSAASATKDGSISGTGSRPRSSSSTIGVSVKPGQSAFSRMPRRSSPGAAVRTKPTTACFVAVYSGSKGIDVNPASDAVATIEPPRGISRRAHSRVPYTTPSRLARTIRA